MDRRRVNTAPASARQLSLALGVANLLALNEWASFVYPQSEALRSAPGYVAGLTAHFMMIAALTMALWALLRTAARFPTPRVEAATYLLLATLLLFPLNAVRAMSRVALAHPELSFGYWTAKVGTAPLVAGALGALAAATAAALRHPEPVVRAGRAVTGPLLVFTLLCVPQGIFAGARARLVPRPAPRAASGPRIVVHVFDEMSERYLTGEGVRAPFLPELSRFRAGAFHATNAFPPASFTAESLPAYLTGALPPDDAPRVSGVPWPGGATIFSDARARGYRSAVAGWMIPYCAMVGADVDRCVSLRSPPYDFDRPLAANVAAALGRVFALDLFDVAHAHRRLGELGPALAADRRFDLVFLHWSIPHLPGVFDPATGRVRLSADESETAYRNNLRLADRTFGAVRRAMEASGIWDETLVLVTSDHALRDFHRWPASAGRWRDPAVPFLVKLPGASTPLPFERPFGTLALRRFLRAAMDGAFPAPSTLPRWIRRVVSTTLAAP